LLRRWNNEVRGEKDWEWKRGISMWRSDRRDAAEQREGRGSFIDKRPNQRSDRISSAIQMRTIQWRAFTLLLTVSGQEVCQLL
jgi:hypothetical protein